MSTAALFTPIKVGDVTLSNRVVLAPLTRCRADANHVPTDLHVEYYRQRSAVPGTLLITEATIIAPRAGGLPNAPGIWNDVQIAAWKKVADVVHKNGSYIYLQLWALGRAARTEIFKKEDPSFEQVAPSAIALSNHQDDVPRERLLVVQTEIKQYAEWFGKAASNAVHGAGFDGVEIHGANGYLVDEFLQDVSNKRTDEYGGSIENRARFALEVVDATVKAVGEKKSAIRLSPWNTPRRVPPRTPWAQTVDFIHKIWAPRPLISTGGYTRDTGIKTAEETGQIIGYGIAFLSNPDLSFRLQENVPFNEVDAATLYGGNAEGYITYPFSEEFLKKNPQFKA